jgi:single-strand DNA-binding protein
MGISRGVNKVILIGNVGKDPEIKHLENGITLAKFSLATTEVYKKDNEKRSTTEWHNIVAFRNLADIIKNYVKKGDALYIEGKIQTRSWDDQDGNKKYMTEIVANNVQMLGGGGKSDNSASSETETSGAAKAEGTSIPDEGDDLPF